MFDRLKMNILHKESSENEEKLSDHQEAVLDIKSWGCPR